jgi:acyl carrier protein
MDAETSIRRFIVRNLMMKKDENVISLDEPLLEKGIVDSWGIVELTEFLKKEFGADLDDADILPENFHSVRTIAALVNRGKA